MPFCSPPSAFWSRLFNIICQLVLSASVRIQIGMISLPSCSIVWQSSRSCECLVHQVPNSTSTFCRILTCLSSKVWIHCRISSPRKRKSKYCRFKSFLAPSCFAATFVRNWPCPKAHTVFTIHFNLPFALWNWRYSSRNHGQGIGPLQEMWQRN